jgi:hypothetical protein
MTGKLLVLVFGLAAAASLPAQETIEYVGRFNSETDTPPPPWRLVRFDERVPPTRYRVTSRDGVVAVEASADASMALLARPLQIDLQRTPVLCWRWQVDGPLRTADMATKRGDDYAARVYVTFTLPANTMSFATRAKLNLARSIYGDSVPDAAINYVWDNRHPVGTSRPNAYTDRTRMIVLRSGAEEAGRWMVERRNVLADFVQAFGTDPASLSLLAIAADTDNTGESARAYFADLHFVASGADCAFSGHD